MQEDYVLKTKSLERSLKEGIFQNLALGFCDNYISPYAIALKFSPFALSLLNGIPNLLGPWSQLFSRNFVTKFKRKLILIFVTLIQSLFYISLSITAILAFLGFKFNYFIIVLLFALYSLISYLGAPVFNSWIGDIVEAKRINEYFALRNSLGTLVGILGILIAGILLDVFRFQVVKNVFLGFALIFFIGAIFNTIRVNLFYKIYEPEFSPPKESYFSFKDFIKHGLKTNFGKFVIFNAILIFSTNISAPFYNLFIFRDLKFSYSHYINILAAASLSSFMGYYIWKYIIDKLGHLRILKLVGALVSLPAFLYIFVIFLPYYYSFLFVLLINLIGGFVWSAHALSTTNFFFYNVSRSKRDLCSAYSNIIYGFSIFLGSLIGGLMVELFENPYFNSIMIVSLISGILRFISGFGFLTITTKQS